MDSASLSRSKSIIYRARPSIKLRAHAHLPSNKRRRTDWQIAFHPDDLQSFSACRQNALENGKEFKVEHRLRCASDGSYRWYISRVAPLKDANGNVVKWFGTSTDIEEQKRAQAKAERASRAKSDFLSSMSHELRSPLNAILGFAQLMASDSPPPPPSQQASIEQILKAGWHLLELINEVLDLAKIEAGLASLSPEPVSLADAMSECHSMVEPQAQKRDIRMCFLPFERPCFVYADRIRLKQILINLLSNAIKYNREHGEVEVRWLETGQDRVRISVQDNGMGLPPDRLAQLFQPFNRLGQEAGPEEGTGIGLVVAKRLVELMGGTIGVESTVGAGSIFWFELGSASAPDLTGTRPVPAAAPEATSEVGTRSNTSLHTLLYVEDNPANLDLVEQIIERHSDMRLLTAVTGHLGVELAHTERPDVIEMDIHLPDMSGFDVLARLRLDPVTAHIPVVALSANAMSRDIEHGMRAGFLRYLTKPIRLDEFMDAISLALVRQKAARKP